MKSRGSRPYILHPFLFALFPVFFLYALNVGQTYFSDIFFPAFLIIITASAVVSIFNLILKDWLRAGLITSVMTLFFFSYGHLARSLNNYISPWLLLVICTFVLLIIIFVIILKKPKLNQTTRILNIVAAALLLIQIIRIGIVFISSVSAPDIISENSQSIKQSENLPDAYFIVLDGYARADVLSEIYQYDNSEFIDFLRNRGFTVADSSHSNYGQTLLSLATTFNMDYVPNLVSLDSLSSDRLRLYERLRHNKVLELFKRAGYTTSAFSSGYGLSEIREVDNYISASWMPGEFANMLLSFTPLPVILSRIYSPFEIHHNRIMHIIANLADRKKAAAPQFVFAHIICPHPPFVFGPNGESLRPERPFNMEDGSHFLNEGGTVDEYRNGYINQVKFINGQMEAVINHLLSIDPENRPIIIIQADHGPGSELSWVGSAETNLKERFSILNAVLLPQSDSAYVYDAVSPVNTFRVIANILFDCRYDLLPDLSYYSTWEHPFGFMPITNDSGRIYEYLLDYYLSLSPGKIKYLHVSHPLPAGTNPNSGQCIRMTPQGLCIDLERMYHSTLMEITADRNDEYLVRFRKGDTDLVEMMLPALNVTGDALRIDTLAIPQETAYAGYDNILIIPRNGDGRYALGHIRLGVPARR
ncbi:MAG: hypothetical protein CVT49_00565 [candidate division Zixibacteria bacterium HGW-Zixibacteria-1]|nr:MAG: hypothetical protein CVT49_00565 [candidate division Zixibacteria bacterium HGW-Zixibacteria-1]